MKKLFVSLTLFATLIFVVSCGGSSKNDDKTDTGETVTDDDSADTESVDTTTDDSDSADTDSTDTTPDSTDSGTNQDDTDTGDTDQGKKQGELYGECYPNKTCNEGLVCDEENNICIKDSGSNENKDDADSSETPDEDADSEPEPSEQEKCIAAGGTYNTSAEGSTCTKTTECKGNPENTEWNGADTYTQTYANGEWSDEITAEYSEEIGVCHYKCFKNYKWMGNHCELKDCSTEDFTPCIDGNLIWSARSEDKMNWQNADNYCKDLNTKKYGGFTGWRMPNISELRTLVLNCSFTEPNGSCNINTSCLYMYEETCDNEACTDCEYDETNPGKHSKFGDSAGLWSSSTASDNSDYAAKIYFYSGNVGFTEKEDYNHYYVRCVRTAE